MPLSANTLIHFTNKKENLKLILEDCFRIFYCKERVSFIDKATITYAAPMVSFCDIPLSEVKDHISKYGNYGIGLTKEWAIKQGLNPVLYLSTKSDLTNSLHTVLSSFMSGEVKNLVGLDSQIALKNIIRYTKNYEGDLIRGNKTTPNYRYSDEREWRYTPEFSDEYDPILTNKKYSTQEQQNEANSKLDKLRLKFEPNDIKYIIINDDLEIPEFIEHIRNKFGQKSYLNDIDRLFTRILTADQIKTDM